MRRWLIVVAFLLVGCVEGETAVPTMTMLAERPSPTVTDTPNPPIPTTTSPTQIPAPTLTPYPTNTVSPTSDPLTYLRGISPPQLSSQGQLAFTEDQDLFLETAVGSHEFKHIEQNVTYTYWSPQGGQLLYGICNRPDASPFDCYDVTWMLHDVQTNQSTPLSEIVSDLPEVFFGFPTWMKHGRKILFGVPFSGEIAVVDLERETFSIPFRFLLVSGRWELQEERFLIQEHLGTYSNSLGVFDIHGKQLWSFHIQNPERLKAPMRGF